MDNTNSSPPPRPFSLGLYLLIVFGLSWPFQIAGAIWATDMLSLYVLNSTAMVMVTVGTFIAGRYIFRDGFANAGWHWGKPKHYLAVAGLITLLWIIPTLIRLAMGTLKPDTFATGQSIWLVALPLVALIPGFGEEFGWRGYMLPRLTQRLSPRKAVALHAVIWWTWHWPVLIGTGVQAGIAGATQANIPVALSVVVSVAAILIMGAIPSILHAVVFAYIWSRSQSLAVATVYHATYDGVRDSLGMITSLPPAISMWASALLSILGIAFLWKGNWSALEGRDRNN